MAGIEASNTAQDLEVKQLKDKYSAECKVISDVGDFRHVVIIRPSNIDISIKFQLTEGYPREKPAVITRSDTIPVDCVTEIQQTIDDITKNGTDQPVMDKIVQQIIALLHEKGLDTARESAPTQRGKKSKGKPRKQIKENVISKDDSTEKKPSMKTAGDVIKRIQWDESLPTESFFIGYLDRFEGIMERGFIDFSWEDLSSVDNNVLAIPQHRIQYFKYNDVIVWDKNKRLDNIFGSTGSRITIHNVIDNYDHFYAIELEQNPDFQKKSKVNRADSDGIEEIDDVEIDFGFQPNTDLNRETKWKADEENMWDDKPRPNHFICFRITDAEIQKNIQLVQDGIVEKETRYISCCPPKESLHVTLCTLGLDTMEQIADTCRILKEAQTRLSEITNGSFTVKLCEVDNFFNRVVYAKVQPDDTLRALQTEIRTLLVTAGIEIRDNFDFTPHLTILKISRPVARELNNKKINRRFYESFSETNFGSQDVDLLYLCEMNDQRDDDFYLTPTTVSLKRET